jgi:hypothetical protein
MSATKPIRVTITKKVQTHIYFWVPNTFHDRQIQRLLTPEQILESISGLGDYDWDDWNRLDSLEVENWQSVDEEEALQYDVIEIGYEDESAIKEDLPPQRQRSQDEMI